MAVIDLSTQTTVSKKDRSWNSAWSLGMQRLVFDHVLKGLQIGSIFGMGVVLPYTIFKDLKSLRVIMPSRLLRKQAASLTLGVVASLLWMGARYISWSDPDK